VTRETRNYRRSLAMTTDELQMLKDLLPLLIPLLLIQVALIVFSLMDLFKPERRVRGGSKLVWALVIIFVSMLGPLVYFLAGREES
jgi:hypothetical protein